MDKKYYELLLAMSEAEYRPSHKLAEKLDVSYKTIRNRAIDLDDILQAHGARIIAKKNMGYRIHVFDRAIFNMYKSDLEYDCRRVDFSNADDRIIFLLEYLVTSNQYIKSEDLCDILYISKKTLSCDLKKVERLLKKYSLYLEKRPNYGFICRGSEWHKRLCITHCLVNEKKFSFEAPDSIDEVTQTIGKAIVRSINKSRYGFPELAIQNLVKLIYTIRQRINQGHILGKEILDDPVVKSYPDLVNLASIIVKELTSEHLLEPGIAAQEVAGLAILLAALSNLIDNDLWRENFVISQEIMDLSTQMLQVVFNIFKVDLRDNLELKMNLCRDLVALIIRIRYDMRLPNPMLREIKSKYLFAYMLASQSLIVIKEHYKTELTDDEIGFFALIYALALESERRSGKKRNILLVCASGKSSAQLLVHKYREEFSEYIADLTVCDLNQIKDVDFSDIDYVFTTVPINTTVPVPILEVQLFPEEKEILEVKDAFKAQDCQFLLEYYRPDLFFSGIKGQTKEEIIHRICEKVTEHCPLPLDFEDSVLHRENLTSTDFGNLIAFPHPFKTMTHDTFAAVGILAQPVLWVRERVQMILLVSVGDDMPNNIQDFYKVTTKFISSKSSVQKLLAAPSFETFMKLISRI